MQQSNNPLNVYPITVSFYFSEQKYASHDVGLDDMHVKAGTGEASFEKFNMIVMNNETPNPDFGDKVPIRTTTLRNLAEEQRFMRQETCRARRGQAIVGGALPAGDTVAGVRSITTKRLRHPERGSWALPPSPLKNFQSGDKKVK
jgi:hypothetical protein